MHRLSTKFYFEYTFRATTISCTQNVSTEEKINVPYICKISCNYFNTWILTDAMRSKNIQKNMKFGWKIRIQQRPDKQDTWKKKCVQMKKLRKLFTTPACNCVAHAKVIWSSHSPSFNAENTCTYRFIINL